MKYFENGLYSLKIKNEYCRISSNIINSVTHKTVTHIKSNKKYFVSFTYKSIKYSFFIVKKNQVSFNNNIQKYQRAKFVI